MPKLTNVGTVDVDTRKTFSRLTMTVNIKHMKQSKFRMKLAFWMLILIRYICPCKLEIVGPEDKDQGAIKFKPGDKVLIDKTKVKIAKKKLEDINYIVTLKELDELCLIYSDIRLWWLEEFNGKTINPCHYRVTEDMITKLK